MSKVVRMPKPKPITRTQLEAIRAKLGYTQAEFAERLGIPLRNYSFYVSPTNKRPIPLVIGLAARCLSEKPE